MATPALVVLAAGIGSRYGGLKQIEPIGPGGETIIDYSVFDALRAGFGKLVFVIRKDIEETFREVIGRRFENRIEVAYVFQEQDKLPRGFTPPPTRKKPWGTGHAVLVAAEAVDGPFAVINGDDFYGARSFQALGEYLVADRPAAAGEEYAMVGFVLRQTLSEFGHVARGICTVDSGGSLQVVVERTHIEKDGAGARFVDAEGTVHPLTGDESVSMNCWGLRPAIFDHLRSQFEDFLKARLQEDKAEFYLPSVFNQLIASGRARVRVLPTPDAWFGVTYREDKPFVDASIRALIARGDYPEKLWD